MSNLTDLSLTEVASLIRTKKASAVEVTQAAIDRAQAVQPRINCFIALEPEVAMAEAKALDGELAKGQAHGPLHGVPLAHKDLFYRTGKRTTCGSRILGDFVSQTTSSLLTRLTKAGAVNLGTLNMSEIAVGASGRNETFGHCRNPWNPLHISGGSSSGSGSAVGARAVYGSLGSDTGGSVRLPATMCGVVGLKPTQGRISRHGVMPLSYSLDNVGPFGRTAKDVAALLQVVAGADPQDPTASGDPVPDYAAEMAAVTLKGLRIGVPTTYYYDDVAPSVMAALEAALAVFRAAGAQVIDVDIGPEHDNARVLSNVLLKAEAGGIHGEWFRTRPGVHNAEVRTRLEAGLQIPAVRYLQAQRLRGPITRQFCGDVFGKVDVMFTPTFSMEVPTLADTDAAIGGNAIRINEKLAWCTRAINYLGLPGLSVPCGFSANGLPVGFQLVGTPFAEGFLLGVADAYQQETGWHAKKAA